MTPLAACTVVARNFLPQARVVASSFREFHEGVPFHVLVIDAELHDAALAEEFDVLAPTDIGFGAGEFHQLAAMYAPRELSTAVKPHLLRFLLDHAERVLFIDPDIEFYAPLLIDQLVAEHGIVMTPHTLAPVPLDGLSPTELELGLTGTYNGGFIGVSSKSQPFLHWWWERLRRDCIFDRREGLFVDQRWLDWIPSYWDHHILKDPTCNVAHWNLHERTLGLDDGRCLVNGEPLKFFHFSGYRPERDDTLTTYQYRNELRYGPLADEPVLQKLCDGYRAKLEANGYRTGETESYGFASSGTGVPLDSDIRRAYRKALIASDGSTAPAPPDPFDAGEAEEFERWASSARRQGGTGLLAAAKRVGRQLTG